MSDLRPEPGPSVVNGDVIRARGLVRRYENGRITALAGLDLDVAAGGFVAVCGPSGCGKSTLLNLLSAVDHADAGTLIVAGHDLTGLDDAAADRFRSTVVGLVFQLHNLLPGLTAVENVQMPMLAAGVDPRSRLERAHELIRRVGLEHRAAARPFALSGGERQRVAVARALANRPRILLADEPTGALDSATGNRLFDLLAELRQEYDMTLVVVTHEPDVAGRADRIVHMLDGRAVSEQPHAAAAAGR